MNNILDRRGAPHTLEIVDWKSIDDESTEQYLGIVRFARNLERHLGADTLWPKIRLGERDCIELERRLRRLCPTVRSEGFLPDWEYAAEHKLPIVPEPLGLISLSRSERRADPLATMGCAVMVVLGAVFIIALMILSRPGCRGARPMMRLGVGLVAVAVIAVLWVANCSGPQPSVGDVRLIPPPSDGAPYRVEATIRNTGRGHGEVAVTVRLRDDRPPERRNRPQARLEEHETTLLVADVPAPPGQYTPDVEVVYPPR